MHGTSIDWPTELHDNLANLEGNIVASGTLGNWEHYVNKSRYGIHMRGYIKAPRTGAYNFWLSSR